MNVNMNHDQNFGINMLISEAVFKLVKFIENKTTETRLAYRHWRNHRETQKILATLSRRELDDLAILQIDNHYRVFKG